MLAGMIFVETPKRVLLAGVGGGAIARYFSGCFPEVKGEAVEISEVISQIAQDFFEFPNTKNWQLVTADIGDYVQHCQYKYDLIVIDIAIEQQTPKWILDRKFLQRCRSLLTENGHIALNLLVDDGEDFQQALSIIRDTFDKNTACLSLTKYRNTVVFAFNNSPKQPTNMTAHLSKLDALWGIEFSEFYRQMLHDNPPKSGII
jgi:spermidine synthase